MRLIDADELKEQLFQLKCLYWRAVERRNENYYYLEAIRILNNAPTIDAVPVVRCKDCKYFLSEDKGCDLFYSVQAEDDYCSSGKRKDGSNQEDG